jgi:hypothetical protein
LIIAGVVLNAHPLVSALLLLATVGCGMAAVFVYPAALDGPGRRAP